MLVGSEATSGSKVEELRCWLEWKLAKPYYVFRPRQILRRLTLPLRLWRAGGGDAQITLPWGSPLTFKAHEQTGLCLLRRGVFDLAVCETLWRLAEPEELVIDVGANIGQMTSALAARLAPRGKVIAFEPHPEIFHRLAENAVRWRAMPDAPPIELRQLALSDRVGEGELAMSTAFDWNMGSASVRDNGEIGHAAQAARVPLRKLDDEIGGLEVGVMKLDVEGHERDVLGGADRLLREQRVRDIVFEEFRAPPTPVSRLLESRGYTLFSIDQALAGPIVGDVTASAAQRSGDDPSYLATVEPDRALRRLSVRGWGVLGVGPAARTGALAVRDRTSYRPRR